MGEKPGHQINIACVGHTAWYLCSLRTYSSQWIDFSKFMHMYSLCVSFSVIVARCILTTRYSSMLFLHWNLSVLFGYGEPRCVDLTAISQSKASHVPHFYTCTSIGAAE